MSPWLHIIGVGEGGASALPAQLQALVSGAQIVLGPQRFLISLTPTSISSPQGGGMAAARVGVSPPHQTLIPWSSPLSAMLGQVEALRGTPTVILATGDPSWFGIGATLARHLDPAEFAIHPHPSAFQLAAARLRWPLQHVATISLHGRPPETLHPHLLPGNRIVALTSDATTLAAVQSILKARGYAQSILTVLENLGGPAERITTAPASNFTTPIGDFYTLAIDCVADPGAPILSPIPGLPDDAFLSDGQLTKRDIRAATLARLAPFPNALLWDIGAGSGSVAIEWMRAARNAKAIAFERDVERLRMIAANAAALGVPSLAIVAGEAPQSLAGQPAPDAIFLGGDVGNEPLFVAAWAALKPGGRFVANAITIDGEQALYARQSRLGGELVRLEISVLDTVGAHRVLRPRMAVTQWLGIKP
jgi:precorrin-6Y C5,15-methyltransferase (decarboxylating)